MEEKLKLMAIFAHPDDESLGIGASLAKYADEGVETYLVCATRGERGWDGDEQDFPGLEAFGKVREAELHSAARVLGLQRVDFLDYIDGDLDQADPQQAIAKIVACLRTARPQIVITFPPDGSYGHPDHIAISQFTAAALVSAADCNYSLGNGYQPHQVSKLYYMVDSKPLAEFVKAKLGGLEMEIDGVMREQVAWEDWAITTRVDATAYWRTAWQAVKCHQSQIQGMLDVLENTPDDVQQKLWGDQTFYRVYSQVNGGRKVEQDLFEGLR